MSNLAESDPDRNLSRQSNLTQGSSRVVHKTTDAVGIDSAFDGSVSSKPCLHCDVPCEIESNAIYIVITVSIRYIGHVRVYLKARL